MTSTRTRGITVQRLDLTALKAQALTFLQQSKPDVTGVMLSPGNLAIATTPSGKTFVVCDEGVGWEISADKPVVIDVSASRENSFDLLPSAAFTLREQEIADLPRGEEVDLADFIRAFGARLESNFHIWANTLSR